MCLSAGAQHRPWGPAAAWTWGRQGSKRCSVTAGAHSGSGLPSHLPPTLDRRARALRPLVAASLPPAESQLASIRKDILEQVQSECRRGSQQLIAELTDFLKAFQSISSDIHAIAWCSQKVSWQALPSQLIQGPAPRSQHLLQDSAELPMRLDALKRLSCSLSWLPGIQGPVIRVMTWCGRNWAVSRETRVRWGSLIPEGPHLVG